MRTPMVTRTVKATKLNALTVNLDTKEVSEQEYIMSGVYKDEAALTKAVAKHSPAPEGVKIVKIISATTIEKLLGITEAEFIAIARPISRPSKSND